MFNVILFQPEIPPNTGNIIRLCANTGVTLHLIHPLGFELDEPRLRRAGLDYHELVAVREHHTLDDCLHTLPESRVFAFSTKGETLFHEVAYIEGDAFLFGSETAGLPPDVLAQFPPEQVCRLPMKSGNRSLNLSNSVAVVVFEAWRQQGFAGS